MRQVIYCSVQRERTIFQWPHAEYSFRRKLRSPMARSAVKEWKWKKHAQPCYTKSRSGFNLVRFRSFPHGPDPSTRAGAFSLLLHEPEIKYQTDSCETTSEIRSRQSRRCANISSPVCRKAGVQFKMSRSLSPSRCPVLARYLWPTSRACQSVDEFDVHPSPHCR